MDPGKGNSCCWASPSQVSQSTKGSHVKVGESDLASVTLRSSLQSAMHTPFSTPSPPLSLSKHHWHPGRHQHLHRHPGHPVDGHHHRGHHHLLRASPCSCMLLQMCPTPSPDHAKCRCSFDRRVRLGEFRASLLLVCSPPPPQVRSRCFWAEVWFGGDPRSIPLSLSSSRHLNTLQYTAPQIATLDTSWRLWYLEFLGF